MKSNFSIFNFRHKTANAIIETVKILGEAPLRPTSHGFERFGDMRIIDAARRQATDFLANSQNNNTAVALMMVVLAANRDFNKQVQPYVARMQKVYPSLTLSELDNMLSQQDFKQFAVVWGHADEKKFNTLRNLVKAILNLQATSGLTDYQRLHDWAKFADLCARTTDPLGSIKNVGIATFQHLRITFGIDTVKPDQRVKEVLAREFGAKLKPEDAVLAVEQIAKITGLKVIEIDQVFVKYGSGYYVS